jgi:hypothetical protein
MNGWKFKEIKNGLKIRKIIPFNFKNIDYYRENIYNNLINKYAIDINDGGTYFENDKPPILIKGYDNTFLFKNIEMHIQYCSFQNNQDILKNKELIIFTSYIPNKLYSSKNDLFSIIIKSTPKIIAEHNQL